MHFIIQPLKRMTGPSTLWNAWNGVWDEGAKYLYKDGTIKGPAAHELVNNPGREELFASVVASSYFPRKEDVIELCKKFGHTWEEDDEKH